jgi:predicted tellurium resistance membrane protein TerC
MRLTTPLFTVIGNEISGRDMILLLGGTFLLFKSTREIHEKLEGDEQHAAKFAKASFVAVIAQIVALDVVFSLDSVITAIGMANQLGIMVTAVILAVGFMLFAAKGIGIFIEQHPTIKMLALSFLLLIGLSLIAEGLDQHVPKGYIYFAMGFSVFVEMLNTKSKTKKAPPVRLRKKPVPSA